MSEKSLEAPGLGDPLRPLVEAALGEFGESLRAEVSRLHQAAFAPGELSGFGSVEVALAEPEA